MMRSLLLVGLVTLAVASAANATVFLSEDFESGTNGWSMLNGTWLTENVAGDTPDHGLSWKSADGLTSRASKGISTGSAGTVYMEWEFYTANTTTSCRSWGGFSAAGGATSNALVRIGTNNNADYQVHWYSGSLQTIDTGVPLAVGWHKASLEENWTTMEVTWKLDGASGTFSHAGLARPGAVTIGYNYSNGTAGSPDSSMWIDNISVTDVPEPATLAFIGLGMVGVLVRRRP